MTWYEFLTQRIRVRAESERGAALVEYALLLAFIAIICVGAVGFLGHQLSERFDSTGVSVAGAN